MAGIEARDDGNGIPAALLSRIFEPFVQGERTLHGSVGGLGIGLALVKNLVELHGGTVVADSAGEGQGSTFTLFVPLDDGVERAAPAGEAGAPAAIDAVSTDEPDEPESDEPPMDGKLAILVVDDNPDAADFLAQLLAAWGHTVRVAYDPVQAIGACAASTPDLAILDIGLPGMDGYELADRLRALPACGQLPCVALTGYGQESDKKKSQEAGFIGHLVKPVTAPELRDLLSAARR